MSSKQTWERRILAGVLDVVEEDGLGLIEGLVVQEDGTFVFSHEELTPTEAERVRRCLEAVSDRLRRTYERLGGAKVEDEPGEDGSGAGGDVGDTVFDPDDSDE